MTIALLEKNPTAYVRAKATQFIANKAADLVDTLGSLKGGKSPN